MPAEYSVVFASVLIGIGLYCLSGRRNMIRLLLGIGILGNAANINYVALSRNSVSISSQLLAESTVMVLIVLEACVIAVGLTIVIYAYRHFKTMDARELRGLRW